MNAVRRGGDGCVFWGMLFTAGSFVLAGLRVGALSSFGVCRVGFAWARGRECGDGVGGSVLIEGWGRIGGKLPKFGRGEVRFRSGI